MRQGACHCGSVRFTVEGPVRDALACHCTQCRKVTGHYWAAASVPVARLVVTQDAGLRWYRSSPAAQRGFCKDCGATLFWLPEADAVFDWGSPADHAISFSPGALDRSDDVRIADHIFTQDKGDYYSLEGPPPVALPAVTQLTGSCLCGSCRFTLPGPAGPITACHCHQCRSLSGHYTASFRAAESALHWQARATLSEYRTGGGAVRGFCSDCGSGLWFRATNGDFAVAAGVIDGPTGGQLSAHVFLSQKGHHYTVDDGLPQFSGAAV